MILLERGRKYALDRRLIEAIPLPLQLLHERLAGGLGQFLDCLHLPAAKDKPDETLGVPFGFFTFFWASAALLERSVGWILDHRGSRMLTHP